MNVTPLNVAGLCLTHAYRESGSIASAIGSAIASAVSSATASVTILRDEFISG